MAQLLDVRFMSLVVFLEETSKLFYVYELIDPRNGNVFYVGKGKGKRAWAHEKEAARGIPSYKCNKIRAIKKLGLKIQYNIVCHFEDEDLAYDAEINRIKEIGIDNLTNVLPGGRRYTPTEEDLAEQKRIKFERAELARQLREDRKNHKVKPWSMKQLRQQIKQMVSVIVLNHRGYGLFHKDENLMDMFLKTFRDSISEFEKALGVEKVKDEFLKHGVRLV